MTDDKPSRSEKRVWCKRLEKKLPVGEHAECPYCFGQRQEIASSKHEDFCDFKPGEDPVNFGFPPDTTRNLGG